MSAPIESHDVIIAGAGPVGLLLACELALAGVKPLVLERQERPDNQWKALPLGLRGLNVPSAESFYRRGLLYKIFDEATRPKKFVKNPGKFQMGGHFAGMLIDANNVDFSRLKYHITGPAGFGGPSNTAHVEAVLTERAEALGVEIRRGTEITRFADDGALVRVWCGEKEITTKWLIGCDGGRSKIRKAAGFEFVGTEGDFTGYTSHCELDRPELLKQGFHRTEIGMYIMMPSGPAGPNVLYVIDFNRNFDPRTQELTKEHFQECLQRVSGTNVVVNKLHLAGSFTDRSKQVTEYRKGRIILAGDSAHIHPPLGAQGLNTGLGDAMNLGWKLAATVKGTAPAALIDTYHAERHPVAAWVLDWNRAQVATLHPNPSSRAVGNVVRDMINTLDGATYFATHIWGLKHRCDLDDTHPLVGCSVPDFEFQDGTRLGPKMVDGRFLLVDLQGNEGVKDFVEGLGREDVRYHCGKAEDDLGLKAVLVRPDGVVAWVAEDEVAVMGLREALARWWDPSVKDLV